jgi:deoxyribonuclease-4
VGALDRIVGLGRVRVLHLNDSLKPLGSRVDRHAGIGRGHLGLEPFRLLVNDPRFQALPMILETPKGEDGGEDLDAVNLGVLRGLETHAPATA